MTRRLTAEDMLRDALAALESTGCQYWACPGPDVPPVSMKTCHVCWEIRRIRAFYARAAARG